MNPPGHKPFSPAERRSIFPWLKRTALLLGPGWRIEVLNDGTFYICEFGDRSYKWARYKVTTNKLLGLPL